MIERKWGRICNISSISALENQGPPAYSAAKAALNAYTRGVGRYLSRNNVIMTSVMPGAIFTEGGYWDLMQNENPLRLKDYLENRMAIGRLGTVEEISKIVAFLVSDNSSFMVGSNVLVDGGQGRVFNQE
jgi:3-oxoacyl-[acyl-carrier protein] reductase